MAYDINVSGNGGVTMPHAPLFVPVNTENQQLGMDSGSAGVQSWIDNGLSPAKIVFGLPFYGYAYELENPRNRGILAPIFGRDNGVLFGASGSYDRIRTFIEQQDAVHQYDENYVADYCYDDQVWICYDDKRLPTVSFFSVIALGEGKREGRKGVRCTW
ncbi:class V chitinase-like [Amaranthus tricolor]|uniref:class V chitinase-like n=1 Tax=Amaranthus tricolor TaxID=29722 RepID=UPI00258C417F|nr:class V chitinase-like [Amaranthus tricolor]